MVTTNFFFWEFVGFQLHEVFPILGWNQAGFAKNMVLLRHMTWWWGNNLQVMTLAFGTFDSGISRRWPGPRTAWSLRWRGTETHRLPRETLWERRCLVHTATWWGGGMGMELVHQLDNDLSPDDPEIGLLSTCREDAAQSGHSCASKSRLESHGQNRSIQAKWTLKWRRKNPKAESQNFPCRWCVVNEVSAFV